MMLMYMLFIICLVVLSIPLSLLLYLSLIQQKAPITMAQRKQRYEAIQSYGHSAYIKKSRTYHNSSE